MRFSKLLHPSILLIAIPVLLLLTTWLPLSARAPHPDTQGASAQTVPAYTQTLIEVSDGVSGDNFGAGVALDGDLLAVGAIGVRLSGQPAGAVYLYERDPQSPSGWTELHRLYGDPGLISPYFGYALALQGDTLIVGAPFHPRDGGRIQGKAYVYERHQGGTDAWGLVTELEDEEDADGRWFGRSVAFDGDLVAVSAVGAEDDRGKVYLYGRAAGWTRIKEFSDPDGQPRDWFGSALALQGDTLVIGAQAADLDTTTTDTGAAFVYGRDQGGADQWDLVARLVADEPQFDSFFGNSLALDGDTIVVGANSEDRYEAGQPVASQVGAAYVYGRDQGGADAWGLLASLRPEDGETLDRFGASVAVSGDDLWVGAPYLDTGGFGNEGALFHYRRDEGGPSAWGLLDTIQADPDSSEATFGSALAAEGQTLLAGAPYHELKGAAYIIVPGDPPGEPDTAYLSLVLKRWSPPTGTLEDGGSLESPAGAIIGAVPGTLNAPLDATIVPVQQPSPPLPPEYTPVGDYYFVSAERLVIAPNDKPFLLGLPVPPGATPGDLAMAVLAPPGAVLDVEEDEALWLPSVGHHDADNDLFVITLSNLNPAGLTVVLITDPAFDPVPTATAPSAQATQGTPTFEVHCGPGDVCTDANRAWVATELQNAYAEFVTTLEFERPLLVDGWGGFEDEINMIPYIEVSPSYSNIWIRAKPCTGDEEGHYLAVDKHMVICLDRNNPPGPTERATVRHELFHAIQNAYTATFQDREEDRKQTLWVLEGTAMASENSTLTQMARNSDWPLFRVTTPLTGIEDAHHYEAQDFWVYSGLASAQILDYLQSIFAAGATPEHVSQAFPLADEYWSWAKNQAIEHHETMDGAFIAPPCTVEPAAIDDASVNVLTYPAQRYVEGVLPPLTSALVEIDVTIDRSLMPVFAGSTSIDNEMRYKVYEPGEPNCETVPDDSRILQNIPAGAKYYVLVSNVSLTDTFTYWVEVD